MSPVIRVDQDVLDELYRRRGVRERNHNAVILRALAEADGTALTTDLPYPLPSESDLSSDLVDGDTDG